MSHGDKRKALIVGINDYVGVPLRACENDAIKMHELLSVHEKGDPNFTCLHFVSSKFKVTGHLLRQQLENLLREEVHIALFYFSGHGAKSKEGYQLIASDFPANESRVDLSWLMAKVQDSPASEVILILDCCHAGGAGNDADFDVPTAKLRNGVTILAATSHTGTAAERSGHGKFTRLLCRGLAGAATDMVGHVSTASLYAYADSFLSLWEQKPVFKTHVSGLTALRYCIPRLKKIYLRAVSSLFVKPDSIFHLDSSFLPHPDHDAQKVEQFGVLKRLHNQGYVQGENGQSLGMEARKNGACKLTEAGKDLHLLVSKGKI
jgi:hypothetical protein